MNTLNQLISLVERYPFYVALILLVALPYAGQLAWHSRHDQQIARENLDKARQTRAELDRQLESVHQYKKFVEEAQQFAKALEGQRLLERQGWTSYAVDIKERWLNAVDLAALLQSAGPAERYYFKPKRLEIISLHAREGLPTRILGQILAKESGRPATPGQEPTPMAGEKVLFSLSGYFLVLPQS
ncbi:MAG: hypothetical protein HQL95_07515 [Magnetococcales bacterium]|nr:hypothetical protein [Magnetococcales bacterium]